jgi:phytoene/squalene synthetase
MAFEVERARNLFQRGLRLVDTLHGRLKLDVSLFTAGGMKVLDLIQRQDYDVLSRRPELSRAAKARLMLGAVLSIARGPAARVQG